MRLFFEAEELLSTGNLTLPLKRNGVVLEVKRGEWTKEKFMAEAEKAKLIINPVNGEGVQKLVDDIYATPIADVERARAALK
jgi:hypothetical protein